MKNGKLELFVPFLFRYHEDPKDYVRLTHYYLKKILEKNGYEVRKFRPEDAPDDLVIGVTKNGKGPFMRVEHFYSKV